jgi:hypothetical protein
VSYALTALTSKSPHRNTNTPTPLSYSTRHVMANEVISYLEMCGREGTSLQRAMNFRLRDDHSVLLMSVRPSAPYQDRLVDDGTTLIYEGHDEPRSVRER